MIFIILLLNVFAANYSLVASHQTTQTKKIAPNFDKKGYPNIATIKSLITAQYLQKFKKISVKQINGGLYSERMFVATTKKNGKKTPLLFFKISKKNNSTEKLLKLQEGPVGKKLLHSNNSKKSISVTPKKNIPHIVWLENIYSYQDANGIKKNIEVTPAAQGQLVQDILDSEDKNMIKKAGYALGKNLASFHQLFMKYNDSDNPSKWTTTYHGDFSVKNTLFNPEADKIYFIDNEGMKEGSFMQDIKTILISLLMFRYLKKHFSTRWPLFLEYCQTFLKGYIQSYSPQTRKTLALFIEKSLISDLNKKLHTKIIADSSLHHTKFNEQEFKVIIHNCLQRFIMN